MQVQDASRRESFTESKTMFDRRNLQAVLVCVLICARSPSVQVCPMFLSWHVSNEVKFLAPIGRWDCRLLLLHNFLWAAECQSVKHCSTTEKETHLRTCVMNLPYGTLKSVGIWKRLPMVMVHRIEQPEQTIKGKPAERLCRILGLLPPASKIGPGRQCFMNQAVNVMMNPWNWGSLATQVDLKSLPQEQPKDSHCQSTEAASFLKDIKSHCQICQAKTRSDFSELRHWPRHFWMWWICFLDVTKLHLPKAETCREHIGSPR